MRVFSRIAVAVLALLFNMPAPAAEGRPRIGLVLAGGGAKGGAHVGVLKVLEEQRIPIDCIAGTSMGALVGAGYASGLAAGDVEQFLLYVDWKSVIGSAGRRDLEPIEQKRAGVTYTNEMELGLRDGRIVAPGGLVDTSRIENLLRVYVAKARLLTDFDFLPIPFRAVATDMVTGQMVVLKSGDISAAMRASMAIPGAFAPVPMDNMMLADGGMVRNIPVDVARDLCADVVIVVNLVEPDMKPEQLQSAVALLSRSSDVMIFANENAQLETLTGRDVRIDVPMGEIGTAAFERVPDTIPLGETAARGMADALSRYSVSPDEYAAWRARVTAAQNVEVKLADVRYEGLKHVNPEYLASRARMKAGDVTTTGEISDEALRMSALHDFDSVGYRLTGDPQNPTLEWLPAEKPIGPSYLRFDLGMYTSAGGDLAFVIYGRHTRSWVNKRGGEWRNEVQFGYENRLETSFYQPLNVAQDWFVEPRVLLQQTIEDIYIDEDRLGKYVFGDFGAGVDLGYNFGNRAQLRLGYNFLHRTTDVDTGPVVFPEGSRDDAGFTLTATWDSRDTRFNPTDGIAAAIEYSHADDSLGSDLEWRRGEIAVAGVIPLGRNLISTQIAAGTNFDTTLPVDRMFTLGGPGSFPGFELGELRASEYWTVSGSYLYKLADILSLRGQAVYVGLRAQVARPYDALDPNIDEEIYGGSIYLSGRTPVGPATFGFGYTSTDAWSIWLAVGRPIGHGTLLERGIFR